MQERGSPLFRPIVVNSNTGMPAACQPYLPKLTFKMARWMAFIDLRVKSLGMYTSVCLITVCRVKYQYDISNECN